MLKRLYFYLCKRKIMSFARRIGCDVDGDVVYYKGKRYYINVFQNVLKKI